MVKTNDSKSGFDVTTTSKQQFFLFRYAKDNWNLCYVFIVYNFKMYFTNSKFRFMRNLITLFKIAHILIFVTSTSSSSVIESLGKDLVLFQEDSLSTSVLKQGNILQMSIILYEIVFYNPLKVGDLVKTGIKIYFR